MGPSWNKSSLAKWRRPEPLISNSKGQVEACRTNIGGDLEDTLKELSAKEQVLGDWWREMEDKDNAVTQVKVDRQATQHVRDKLEEEELARELFSQLSLAHRLLPDFEKDMTVKMVARETTERKVTTLEDKCAGRSHDDDGSGAWWRIWMTLAILLGGELDDKGCSSEGKAGRAIGGEEGCSGAVKGEESSATAEFIGSGGRRVQGATASSGRSSATRAAAVRGR
ncbi:uncharacterized protein A4U43_UnF10320 [Asparagus officinalis]|uniref:Uncharacterized protein n=1 Tax=Asparagus officinalis TaxID=4686 RepID=A0A1R3L5I2_ASPOF|nr:uncharacterized protein A4U43_UnF10320 [Asparagus officinalis]